MTDVEVASSRPDADDDVFTSEPVLPPRRGFYVDETQFPDGNASLDLIEAGSPTIGLSTNNTPVKKITKIVEDTPRSDKRTFNALANGSIPNASPTIMTKRTIPGSDPTKAPVLSLDPKRPLTDPLGQNSGTFRIANNHVDGVTYSFDSIETASKHGLDGVIAGSSDSIEELNDREPANDLGTQFPPNDIAEDAFEDVSRAGSNRPEQLNAMQTSDDEQQLPETSDEDIGISDVQREREPVQASEDPKGAKSPSVFVKQNGVSPDQEPFSTAQEASSDAAAPPQPQEAATDAVEAEDEAEDVAATNDTPTPTKRKPGRPPKKTYKAGQPNTTADSTSTGPAASAELPVKRDRSGSKRTPRSTDATGVVQSSATGPVAATATSNQKRKRGRPSKTKVESILASVDPDATVSEETSSAEAEASANKCGKKRKEPSSFTAPASASKKAKITPSRISPRKLATTPASYKTSRTNAPSASKSAVLANSLQAKMSAPKKAPVVAKSNDANIKAPVRLAFSNSSIPGRHNIIKFLTARMGGKNVTTPHQDGKNYDALLVSAGQELQKTYKILLSVALGKQILSDAWLTQSALQGEVLDTEPFELAKKSKQKYDVEAGDLVKDGKSRKALLKGRTLFVTPAMKREYGVKGYSDLESLAKVIGAKELICKSKRGIKPTDNDLIIGSEKYSDIDAIGLMEQGAKVFHKEKLSLSIFRGELDLQNDEFRMSEPARRNSSGSSNGKAGSNKVSKAVAKSKVSSGKGAAPAPRPRGRPKKQK